MSIPTGVLSYGTTAGIQAALTSLNTELTAMSGATMAASSIIEPMGMEGASIVASVQQLANQASWEGMFMMGMGFMQMDTAANMIHVAEVQAADGVSHAVVSAVDLAGTVMV
ncbi:hypothetical protein H7J87_12165 [Mycolicibacterium wolinskyi]|uniref:Uncharacterized protein n=1 Tax=Mycolicibacterium wolinskyi TaxID=59750 RepID=A0A1X2FKK2_9MYCO|nr:MULTISPECIES: hypothetical protein [Mycolicibacterium]MCV7286087.1 hypothetical protein [Mycolicibacterium wolinskyi]MCV7296283.1 hypothetical protein [Mycolicibacterium goodii]ORX18509.1 hypothetical protein AWC31_14500 [Mycolicibacterium wolinskyi]